MNKIEITPELLADLKAKAEKATPGPWWDKENNAAGYNVESQDDFIVYSGTDSDCECDYGCEKESNAAYIAAANPQVVLAMIAEIENLRFNFEALRNFLDKEDIKTPEETATGCYNWINGLLVQRDKERKEYGKQVERLEEKADWLANLIGENACVEGEPETTICPSPEACKNCWREAARKAVEENSK